MEEVCMLIGIDVGTTAVKAALLDFKGGVRKTFASRYPTHRPASGHAEQDPQDWMRLVLEALVALGSDLPRGAVQAIGLCSQVNTHVFADEVGRALMPAITWQDTRAQLEAEQLDAKISLEEKIAWWGAPLPIDASHVLARARHVARNHSAIWNRTRWIFAPKDYCLFHLTGVAATDPMTSFGIVDSTLKPISALVDLVPDVAKRLPPLAGFTSIIGQVHSGLPLSGTPVVTGAMDAWSGLLGAGAARDGDGLYLSGTSEILGILSHQKAATPGVIAFPECEGILFHAGPTQSGGASVEWLSKLLGKSAADISLLAADADMSRPLPLFLPHLEGERAPLWDATSRGVFAGMTSVAGSAELSRAVLEGVGYSARLVFEALEKSACLSPKIINHSGGGSGSDIWCQLRADILGCAVQRTAMRDAGVLGAALMAGVGAGVFKSLRAACKAFVIMDRMFEPNAAELHRHAARFEAYKTLYEQMKPVISKLV
jgi:xylulokinase